MMSAARISQARHTASVDVAGLLRPAKTIEGDTPADRVIASQRAAWERWRMEQGLEDRRAAEIEAERGGW